VSGTGGAALGARERWATRIGLVLAVAGNAIGLGNFLRFPRQAAENGGGAFLIPYFVCLLLIGIPLMWVEMAIGRHGGRHGRGHTAGMFELLWRSRLSKYVGALGLFIPFVVALYYVYVTSWCLAYSFFSLTGEYLGLGHAEMSAFLSGFQGAEGNPYFGGVAIAYLFFLVTVAINVAIVMGGVARGIERLALTAMPLLFLFGIVLAVRVLSLDPPAGAGPGHTVLDGLGFVWNPDLAALGDIDVWLAAAGQIFFTLSVGWGIIHCYASYVGRDDDVALTGFSSASLNEFAEVILGGTIALTAAAMFFGAAEATRIAQQGSFDLGFVAMPLVTQQMPAGGLFGAMWFLLLFFAGLTSCVALMQPMLALLQEDLGVDRRRAVALVGGAIFVLAQPVIFFLHHGFMDELDFWAGSFALLAFGLVEVVIFAWAFGLDNGWEELTRGARMRVPRVFRFVIAWVMPLGLAAILALWSWQNLGDQLTMRNVDAEDRPFVLGARLMMLGILVACFWLARSASRARERARSAQERSA
jgi:SNF family Na+-dependent transporter